MENDFIKLAYESIKASFNEREVNFEISEEMKNRAGVFVSLHKNGELRGCIGTIEPQKENVYQEIISNAKAAAFDDARFEPLTAEELADLKISVDVLGEPQMIQDHNDLDPKKYGIIVSSFDKKGVLLPDLLGVDTIDQQISIACDKAGIDPNFDPITIYKFIVTRYGEH